MGYQNYFLTEASRISLKIFSGTSLFCKIFLPDFREHLCTTFNLLRYVTHNAMSNQRLPH